jgi:hypothetical protein
VGFGNSLPRFKWLFQFVLILICVCIHTYFQAKLNSNHSDITIHMSDSKSPNILSDGCLTDILRPGLVGWIKPNVSNHLVAGLEFPWNQSTAMALKIAVERNSCLRQFWQFPRHFFKLLYYKNLILLLLWIPDRLETCLRISLVFFFSKKAETKIVVYAWFDQHLNPSIKIVMHSE